MFKTKFGLQFIPAQGFITGLNDLGNLRGDLRGDWVELHHHGPGHFVEVRLRMASLDAQFDDSVRATALWFDQTATCWPITQTPC